MSGRRVPRIILGLDPGLARTGWGLVAMEGTRLAHIAHGAVGTDPTDPVAQRLARLHCGLAEVMERHRPTEAAVEEVFLNRNPQSSLKLGQARGVVILCAAEAGLPVSEHATRLVKKALVGTGSADKAQVAAMVARLLPGCGFLGEDEADALAVAIAHAHLCAGHAAGLPA
jgi:crossover junction endodeoxyribonuclease RuvC